MNSNPKKAFAQSAGGAEYRAICQNLPVSFFIRNATNRDTGAIVAIIRAVYDEYGFSWDEHGYHADLYDVESHYWKAGHAFWVAEAIEDGAIYGTCGLHMFSRILPSEAPLIEVEGQLRVPGADCSLERLYVHPLRRRIGVGATLFEHAIASAQDNRKRRMEIWSDKKLEDAHRMYQKFGAQVVGDRICNDPDSSPEYGLVFNLGG